MEMHYLGEKFNSYITITDEMVMNYAKLSGDENEIHINEEAAKKSIFGRRVVHGMLIASFISKIIGMDMPGKGTIYLNQELSFRKPVYINDVININVEITEINNGKAALRTYVERENDIVVEGTAKVKLAEGGR